MGLHMNWLAVENGDKAEVLARLGLAEVGWGSEEFMGEYACARLNGWLVVVSRDWKLDLDAALPALSSGRVALGCEASETVMFSSARAFRDGVQLWKLTHESDKGLDHLDVQGDPPVEFADIRARLAAQQDADDEVDFIYEAPLRQAASLTGYFPLETAAPEWTLLRRAGRGAPPAAPDRSASLAEALRAELLPLLETHGWRRAPDTLASPPRYDAERVLDGRQQMLAFTWAQEAQTAAFALQFTVYAGPTSEAPVLIGGVVAPLHPPRPSGPSLWRRITSALRPQAEPPPPAPEERLAALVAEAREELLAADAFLSRGERHPLVDVQYGSIDDLWPPA